MKDRIKNKKARMLFINYCTCKEGGLPPTRLYGEQNSKDSCTV